MVRQHDIAGILLFFIALSLETLHAQPNPPENILGLPWGCAPTEVRVAMKRLSGVEPRAENATMLLTLQYGGGTLHGREVRDWFFGFLDSSLALAYVEFESGARTVFEGLCRDLTRAYGSPLRTRNGDSASAVALASLADESLVRGLLETEQGDYVLWTFGHDGIRYAILCSVTPAAAGVRAMVTLGFFERNGLEELLMQTDQPDDRRE